MASFEGLLSPLTLFILIVGWCIAVMAGPFGTFATMTWPVRVIYWGCVIGIGLMAGIVARALMMTIGIRAPVRFDLGASLLTCALLAPAIQGLRGWLDPVLTHGDLKLWSIAFNTFMIVAGVFVLRRMLGAEQPAGYLGDIPEEAPRPRLHRRLSEVRAREIMRLSANDHFVDVATDAGQETLRLRLVDAIAEMEPVAGLCTHRSHWVTLSAITGLERESGGKVFVRLRNGDRVPVSRKYRPRLEAAGWINGEAGGPPR